MKVISSGLILVVSMHTVDMFIMLHDLDTAYQVMAEQHYGPDKTPDGMDNGELVTTGINVHDHHHPHLGRDEKEERPPPYLSGWEWLTG